MSIIDPPISLQHQGRQFQTLGTVRVRVPVNDATFWRWIKEDKFPQPVTINGVRYWYKDEVDAWMASQPRGQGFKPVAAIAARARRIEERRAEREAAREAARAEAREILLNIKKRRDLREGRTRVYGFVRRAP
jgi:predicted DNA-binding transcriptional regulator AlpA